MLKRRKQIINRLVGFGQRAIGPYANRIGQSVYARNVNVSDLPAGFQAFGELNGVIKALVRGEGAVTFERQTEATVQDFEGLTKTAIAHEIRVEKGRRVENVLQPSNISQSIQNTNAPQEFSVSSSGAYTPGSVYTEIDLSADANARVYLNINAGLSIGTGSAVVMSFDAQANSGSGTIPIKLLQGAEVSVGLPSINSTSWTRVSVKLDDIPAAGVLAYVGDRREGGTIQEYKIRNIQVEDASGQANQNPSEYVSVGVATGGVEFQEDWDSWTGDNPDGWAIGPETPGTVEITEHPLGAQYITDGTVLECRYDDAFPSTDRDYFVSITLEQATDGAVKFGWSAAANEIDAQFGSAETRTYVVRPTSTNLYIQRWSGATDVVIGQILIAPADHGLSVDGVKAFAYENGNTVDGNNVVTEAKGAALTDWRFLFESASTNEFTYSEQFDNAAWIQSPDATINANYTEAPDGLTTADQLIDDNTGGTGLVYVDRSYNATGINGDHTVSIFAKADQLSRLLINTSGFEASANGFSVFNLSAGTVQSEDANHTARIESCIDGWYRCSITFNLTGTDNSGGVTFYVADDAGGVSVDKDGTSSIHIWGAQAEYSPVPTTYIGETTTAAVTRTADNTSPMFDYSNWSQTEGTWYVDFWISAFSGTQHLFGPANIADSHLFLFAGNLTVDDGTDASDVATGSTVDNRYRGVSDFGTSSTKEVGVRDIDGAGSFSWDGTPSNYDGAWETNSVFNVAYNLSRPIRLRDLKGFTTRKGKDWVENNL